MWVEGSAIKNWGFRFTAEGLGFSVHLPGGEEGGRNVFVPFSIRPPAPVDHLVFGGQSYLRIPSKVSVKSLRIRV